MARSFFAGTDDELYAGSAHFTAKINSDPSSYGLSTEQCESYSLLNARFASAYLRATAPATRTTSTVIAKNDVRAELRIAAAKLAKLIDAMDFVSGEQKIALGLNVRAKASPLGSPGKPYAFRVELFTIGTVKLRWKCDSPRRGAGVAYMISRKIGSETAFTFVARSGKRSFVDATIPAGSSSITYQVRAVRSTAEGDVAEFNLNFGVDAGTAKLFAETMKPLSHRAA